MAEILLFFLKTMGITNLVVNASIFDIPRGFIVTRLELIGKLISCMLCTGFWIGFVLWFINPVLFLDYGILAPFCAGASASLVSHLYDIVTDCMIHYLE